jgi:hypothetical protein
MQHERRRRTQAVALIALALLGTGACAQLGQDDSDGAQESRQAISGGDTIDVTA